MSKKTETRALNLNIPTKLFNTLQARAEQAGVSKAELVCKGLEIVLGFRSNSVDIYVDNLLQDVLKRLSLLESKVDVDIDVEQYLQEWENSLESRILSLIDSAVDKRVEGILKSYRILIDQGKTGLEKVLGNEMAAQAQEAAQSEPREALLDTSLVVNDDLDDEPDEILYDFLQPETIKEIDFANQPVAVENKEVAIDIPTATQPMPPNQAEALTTVEAYKVMKKKHGFSKSITTFKRWVADALESETLGAELTRYGLSADFATRKSANPKANRVKWLYFN